MSFDLVPYSPARRQEIADLLNLCLARKATGERDAAYWAWKHEQNPFGPSLVWLAECDGRLVGVRAFMRWRLRCGDRTLAAAKPVDTVTHPEYQRRGVFRELTTWALERAREDGVRLLFNTPNPNSLPGYLKLGWQEIGRLALLARWLQPVSAVWQLACSRFRRGAMPEVADFFRSPPQPAADVLRDAGPIQSLLQAQAAVEVLATDRTPDFLRWRYTQHPHLAYFAETIGDGERLDGVLFYRTNLRSGMREIMIDDLLLRRPDRQLARHLIENLRRRVSAHYLVAHAAVDDPLDGLLRCAGFRRLPRRRITLVGRPLGEPLEPDPLRVQHWSLCLGDLEGL